MYEKKNISALYWSVMLANSSSKAIVYLPLKASPLNNYFKESKWKGLERWFSGEEHLVPAEVLGLIPSTHLVAQNHL